MRSFFIATICITIFASCEKNLGLEKRNLIENTKNLNSQTTNLVTVEDSVLRDYTQLAAFWGNTSQVILRFEDGGAYVTPASIQSTGTSPYARINYTVPGVIVPHINMYGYTFGGTKLIQIYKGDGAERIIKYVIIFNSPIRYEDKYGLTKGYLRSNLGIELLP